MTTLIVCDIDNTIANIEAYLGLITIKPKNWAAFGESIPHHAPIAITVNVIAALAVLPEYDVVFLTGRQDNFRDKTQNWLEKVFHFPIRLYMRSAGDYRKNYIVKEEITKSLMSSTYTNYISFEDDPDCVKMFRGLGFVVYDVGHDQIE